MASSRRATKFNEDSAISSIKSPKPQSREEEMFNQLGYSQSYQRLHERSMVGNRVVISPVRHQSLGRVGVGHARNQSQNIQIADSNQNSAELRREGYLIGPTNSIINYRHANDQYSAIPSLNEPINQQVENIGNNAQILPQLKNRDGSSSHRYARSSIGATLLPSYQVSIGKVPFTGSDVSL